MTAFALMLWGLVISAAPATRYQVIFRAPQADHFIAAAPGRGPVELHVDARRAPPKSRVMWTAPWAAGTHQVHVAVKGARADRTLVVAIPVAPGRSTFAIQVDGRGRYDFGFFAGTAGALPREYRFTIVGPAVERFEVDLPARRPAPTQLR